MTSTVTTTQSYGSRVANAFKGILIGLVLFVVGICLLWTNEGRSVKRYRALKEGAASVISVSADQVDSANQGKLIHISGSAKTDDILRDKDFPVEVNAIRLSRNVEMYQWVEDVSEETHTKLGGSTETVTTYDYHKTWVAYPVDSSGFHEQADHYNPSFAYQEDEQYARNVTLGAFTLSDSIIQKIGPGQHYAVSSAAPAAEPAAKQAEAADAAEQTAETAEISETTDSTEKPAENPADPTAEAAEPESAETKSTEPKETEQEDTEAGAAGYIVFSGGYYIGENPNNPVVGDTRVTFDYVPSDVPVSIVSSQTGNSFTPYSTKNGPVELVDSGLKTADEQFDAAQKANTMMTWLLRLLGAVVIFIGLKMVFAPLSVIGDVLPFLGTLIGWGTSAVSFVLALIISLIIIAVAWLYYRPILAGSLLAAAAALLVWMVVKSRAAGKQKALADEEKA